MCSRPLRWSRAQGPCRLIELTAMRAHRRRTTLRRRTPRTRSQRVVASPSAPMSWRTSTQPTVQGCHRRPDHLHVAKMRVESRPRGGQDTASRMPRNARPWFRPLHGTSQDGSTRPVYGWGSPEDLVATSRARCTQEIVPGRARPGRRSRQPHTSSISDRAVRSTLWGWSFDSWFPRCSATSSRASGGSSWSSSSRATSTSSVLGSRARTVPRRACPSVSRVRRSRRDPRTAACRRSRAV